MEVTKREILFSAIILAIMIGLGVWISNPLVSKASEKALKVVSATRVKDSDNFDYIRRTNVGHFIAEGELIANDTLRSPDLQGIYSRIEKITEEYRLHTETYTTTDGKGHVQVHTRTYHSWDEVKRENNVSTSFTFLGKRFTAKEIKYNVPTEKSVTVEDKTTKWYENERRFVYRTTPIVVSGIMDGTAEDKAYKELTFKKDYTIDKAVEKAEKNIGTAPVVFWILWSIVIASVVTLFYVCENKWLY